MCDNIYVLQQDNERLRAANEYLRALNLRVIKRNNELQEELNRLRAGLCPGWTASWERQQEERHA